MMDDRVATLIRQGQEAMQRGNPGRAREYLRAAVDLDPNHAGAWLWLSGVLEDPYEARDALERVLQLEPENVRAQQGLMELQARLGEDVGRAPVGSALATGDNLTIEQELRAVLRANESSTDPAPARSDLGRFAVLGAGDRGDMPYRVAVAVLSMTLVIGMLCVVLLMLGVGPFTPAG